MNTFFTYSGLILFYFIYSKIPGTEFVLPTSINEYVPSLFLITAGPTKSSLGQWPLIVVI